VKSAVDVTTGSSAMGDPAGPGPDAATGAGLVDAKWAWLITMGGLMTEIFATLPAQQMALLGNGHTPVNLFVEDLMQTLRSH
jgi:serine protease AprX